MTNGLTFDSENCLSPGKVIATARPEVIEQVGFRSMNNKRRVEFQVSGGCHIGKLPSQRARHKDRGRT